jgi:uncharacterized protein (DUF58 family)
LSPANWLPLLIIIFLAGALLQTNWIVVVSTAMMMVIGAAHLWRQHSLRDVIYRRRWHYRRGFPGEATQVRIEIENKKRLPLSWLRILDLWPLPVAPTDEKLYPHAGSTEQGQLLTVIGLRGHDQVKRTHPVEFKSRGIHDVGPVTLESGDLFGLYTITKQIDEIDTLTVFPEMLPLKALNLPTDDPFGDLRSRRRLFEDPTSPTGVRPYQPEDEFRRVHWAATARTGSLQVKTYQPVSSRVMLVCLNVLTTTQPWLGSHRDLFEQLIKVAATLTYESHQAGYSVGLISNGCLARADQPFQISPGRSNEQLAQLLGALAAVTQYTSSPFENLLMKALPKVPYGSTMVVVTGLLSAELIETMMTLKRYRPSATLFSLQPEPPPHIPGIRTIHLPFEPAGGRNST